jgi:DNA-binding CsgD family transcriptional regulator
LLPTTASTPIWRRTNASEKLLDIRRMASELRGQVDLDFNRRWGTTMTCSLPLHDRRCLRENPAAPRLSELRDRECEVLALIAAGLRNTGHCRTAVDQGADGKFDISNALAKLQVGSRAEAIALAHRAGVSMVLPVP